MKKNDLRTLVDYLNGKNVDITEVKAALEAELEKDVAAKDAKAAEYDAIREVVFTKLGDAPMTVAELFAACEAELPEGVTKNKMQYGLLNYWKDEVIKIEGKPNQYRRK